MADVLRFSSRIAACPAAYADVKKCGLRSRVSVKRDGTVTSDATATQFVPAALHGSGDARQRLTSRSLLHVRQQSTRLTLAAKVRTERLHEGAVPVAVKHRSGAFERQSKVTARIHGRVIPAHSA
jgi:hypothetical protein